MAKTNVTKLPGSDDTGPADVSGKRLKQPKTLAEMRESPVFRGSLLFRQFRLSVVPLTDAQYEWLLS